MRDAGPKQIVLILAACIAALPALADGNAPDASAYRDTPPVVGGLSLVPERWRYRPEPRPIPFADDGIFPSAPAHSRLRPDSGLRTLEAAYVADRTSFVNTLRARRGLSLLTLWEGAGRCLFLGVDDRGRAGINFVRLRTPDRARETEPSTQRLYAALTGQPRATFPEPPRLFEY